MSAKARINNDDVMDVHDQALAGHNATEEVSKLTDKEDSKEVLQATGNRPSKSNLQRSILSVEDTNKEIWRRFRQRDWEWLLNLFVTELIDWYNVMRIALPKVPAKWFDWLKWILIIGAISTIEKQNPDEYLRAIIYISYVAISIDIYYQIDNIFNKIYVEQETKFMDKVYGRFKDELNFQDDGVYGKLIANSLHSYLIIVNLLAMTVAIIVTYFIYALINHVVNLYISIPVHI